MDYQSNNQPDITMRYLRFHCATRLYGFLMAETLMSLVIGGVLMLALGSAVVIFVNSTTSNRDYVASVQAARLSLLRMGAVVRKCNSCQVGETAPTAGSQTVTGTVLKVIPSTGTGQAYRYQTFQGRK